MSYLALARKWRPRSFSELVGQEHVSKVLINSLNSQKLHHAYLFTGTRGVGKTSIARLFAKCLNCEQGISSNPCMSCETCIAIEEGRFFDLVEIDGASKTRVEDTREILDNVLYAPTSGRYKIYLIDEVHMLSQHSFNALLKTLEEPPSHVIFLFATTEIKKLPITILSRCLQFYLRPITSAVIVEQLVNILSKENINFETEALQLLAKAAAGSMRDALSLLDQAIAASDNLITKKEVQALLGHTQQDYALQFLQLIAATNAVAIISLCKQIAAEGGHFTFVLEEILEYLHQITLRHYLPKNSSLEPLSEELNTLAQQFKPEDVQLLYQIGLKGLEDMQHAPTLVMGFEMTLIRMHTFMPAATVPFPVVKSLDINKSEASATLAPESIKEAVTLEPAPIKENPILQRQIPLKPTTSCEDWPEILKALKLTGLTQNAAENSVMSSKSGRNVCLQTAKGHQSLFTKAIIQRLEQALSTYYSEDIKIELSFAELTSSPAQLKQRIQNQNHEEAKSNLEADPFLNQLKEEFSADIVKNSIESLQNEL